jgi:hypothetical protein
MWSLGKVIQTPEVLRVYMGSFWDQPLRNKSLEKLFMAEQADLLADLRSLPRNSTVRKVNELIKRSRMLKVHVHILDHLQNQFGVFGKQKMHDKICKNLLEYFKAVQQQTQLPMGDFPHLGNFKEQIIHHQLDKFPSLKDKKFKKLLAELDQAISVDIPKNLRLIPSQPAGGDLRAEAANPFAAGSDNAMMGQAWAVERANKSRYDNTFVAQELVEGKLSGLNARNLFMKSRLSTDILRQIWNLADCDEDGYLDKDEFAVAMCLIECHTNGLCPIIPANLPAALVPPSKRDLYDFQ